VEPPDVRAAAQNDPRGFLAANPPPVVLDEVHYAPDLLSYIKEYIDSRRDTPGQFVLSGSHNFLVMQRVTETLAGRAAILRLFPLSRREIDGVPDALLPWEAQTTQRERPSRGPRHIWEGFLRGAYPELIIKPDHDYRLWHASYIQTYLERDVRMLRHVGDLTLFQGFLRAIAARSGQILNVSEVARDLGIAVNSVKAWLSVLEASFQVIVVRPYFANIGKRLVKSPKIYLADTGTLCHLVGLKDPEHTAQGPMAGQIFETAVVSELVKAFAHRGEEPCLYFWRTARGEEVDIIVEHEGMLIPIEVKATATPRPEMAASILRFQKDFASRTAPGYVIHGGDQRLPIAPRVSALPISAL
jgi:hypothetical protein